MPLRKELSGRGGVRFEKVASLIKERENITIKFRKWITGSQKRIVSQT
jgi:hypothetical protein